MVIVCCRYPLLHCVEGHLGGLEVLPASALRSTSCQRLAVERNGETKSEITTGRELQSMFGKSAV